MNESRNEKSSTKAENRAESGDFSIDLLSILSRRVGLIVLGGLIGCAVGACYFIFLPPSYESKAQILLMNNDSGAIASSMQNGESISEDLLATHMSLMQSKRIVGEALKTAELEEVPSIIEKLSEDKTATDYVIDNLYVTRGGSGSSRGARVLSLAFRHSEPEVCQQVVSAIIGQYRKFVESKFKDVNQEAVRLINTARLDLENEIGELSVKYRDFKSNAPIMSSTSGGPNIFAQRYEELSAELSQLQLNVDESRGRLELVRENLATFDGANGRQLEKLALIDAKNAERLGIIVTVESGEAQTAQFQALQPQRMGAATAQYSSLLALKAQLKQATEEYGANHPQVKTFETQLKEMEEFFTSRESNLGVEPGQKPITPDDVMAAYVSLLDNDVLALEKRKKDLLNQISEAELAAKALVSVELEDEALVRELDRHEVLYNSVVERLRDINMQQDSSALIQEEIAAPEIGEKVSPKGSITAAIAMLTSLLTAGATILVAELRDEKIRSADDLESIYQARVLGQIPDFDANVDSRRQMRKSARSKSSFSPQLFTYHEPQSRISEVFRGMRTQLLFDLSGTNRLIAVTSPNQGDGKSTVTANLAISLAKTSKTVLLIDGDMRRPSVHKLFGKTNKFGLAELLQGKGGLADALIETECANLTLLLTGSLPSDPAELLSLKRFSDLLDAMRQKFDYVIIDCPPLLPVADPAIVAPLVDRVIVVTSIGSKGLPEAEQCHRILDSVNAQVAGVVINRSGLPGAGYRYSEYEYMSTESAASV